VYVEQMYNIIYTYIYTGETGTVYFHSEMEDNLTFIEEVEHVFSYYKKMGILQSYSCTCINLTKEAVDDLLLLAGWNGTSMTCEDFNIIEPFFDDASIETKQESTFIESDKLGCVTFFNKKWYLPSFNTSVMSCKDIMSHIPSSSLLEWYTTHLTPTNHPTYSTYKILCDRLERLTVKESNQDVIEPCSNAIESITAISFDTVEVIDTYLQIYLEPVTKSELLLSDIYEDYMSRGECMPHVKKAIFIRQLRTHTRFTIVRQARGMVVTNFTRVNPCKIYYMKTADMFSQYHKDLVETYKQKNYPNVPYSLEAFFLLSNVTKTENINNILIQYFVADKLTEPLLKECSEYLKRLPVMNNTTTNFIQYIPKIQSLWGEEYFPFVKTIACKNHTTIFDIEASNQLGIDTSYSHIEPSNQLGIDKSYSPLIYTSLHDMLVKI
jgi:hypothetical protein